MFPFQIVSPSEQVAVFLRGELGRGRWSGEMPGAPLLAADLGVDRKTVEAGLCLLEQEGLLVPQGAGRRRKILLPDRAPNPSLRVAILLGEAKDRKITYILDLEHALAVAGHLVYFPRLGLLELGMELRRIAKMVEANKADAWVVGGASHEVLEWFAARKTPVFALFGRRRGVAVAGVGPDKPPALVAATRALIAQGHRRIVLLARRMRRVPVPGASEQAFLNELAAHGIAPGPYHLPDWVENVDGFYARLDSLFQLTPPTALIIDEAPLFVAVQQFFAGRTIRVPQDVSLVCTDASPDFDWCRPTVAHLRWDSRPVVRRIVRWVANVASGKEDRRQTLTPTVFVPGGTISACCGTMKVPPDNP